MKVIVLVLLVGLAAFAQAQLCVAPKQWEGRIFEFIGSSEADITEFRIGKESYDATNLRRRYVEEQMEGRERDYYDDLFLHNVGMGYRVNLRTRECQKYRLTEKFRPVEVPANTTLESTNYLGAKVVPNNNVEMNFYSGNTPEGYYRGAWTVKDCFPYIHSYLSVTPQARYFRKTMLDINIGISDPNVFEPPRECQ